MSSYFPSSQRVVLDSANNVPIHGTDWLKPGYFPRGQVTVLAGNEGSAPMSVAISFVAALSNGDIQSSKWFDGSKAPLGFTVISTRREEIEDDLMPQLSAAGTNLSQVAVVRGTHGQDGKLRQFDPSADLIALDREIEKISKTDLVVIDRFDDINLTGVDKTRLLRRCLEQLGELAQKHNCVVVVVVGVGRPTIAEVSKRIGGSLVPRRVLMAVKVENEEANASGVAMGVLVRLKPNPGTSDGGFVYQMGVRAVPTHDQLPASAPYVTYVSHVPGAVETVLKWATDSNGTSGEKVEQAKDFLRQQLAAGPVACSAVREALGDGFSDMTLRRARESLGVEPGPRTGGQNTWRLSDKPSGVFIQPLVESQSTLHAGVEQDAQPDHGEQVDQVDQSIDPPNKVEIRRKRTFVAEAPVEDHAEQPDQVSNLNTHSEPVIDSPVANSVEGSDHEGYGPDGFNCHGFNQQGFDRDGYDGDGFNQRGFDRSGFDAFGYDWDGYNREGIDRHGFNKSDIHLDGRTRAEVEATWQDS